MEKSIDFHIKRWIFYPIFVHEHIHATLLPLYTVLV